MKQVLQNRKSGKLRVEEVPQPALLAGGLLVENAFSAISVGTERTSVTLGSKSLLGKARARPDQVRKVIEMARREGLPGTYRKVMGLLDSSNPLGYSCAGRVLEVGEGVADFDPGDLVACAGSGYANHAERIFVPNNLCARVPASVSLEQAAFTTMGAIALQGVRQAEVTVGERVAVIGLGLVGQLTTQILSAAGCQVFGIDLDPSLVDLAKEGGMTAGTASSSEARDAIFGFSQGIGVDAVIITAGTKSAGPIEMAGHICRDRGRVIVVGAAQMNVPRTPYYEKELTLRLSRSYGPGRYDPVYEEKGVDYPVGYVRWTENRNMAAFLQLVADGKVQIDRLVTHRFDITNAEEAYELITDGTITPRPVGVVLKYAGQSSGGSRHLSLRSPRAQVKDQVGLGVIGAGGFARGTLLPLLKRMRGVDPVAVATATGATGKDVARNFGFESCGTDYRAVLDNDRVHAVVIATRHDMHARLAIAALEAGKTVFVEKPLALTEEELTSVTEAVLESTGQLMVGFNRRFSPMATSLRDFVSPGPLMANYRINAGPVDADHWTQDPSIGGGRIKGEVCHFVDFLRFLTSAPISKVSACQLGSRPSNTPANQDAAIEMSFGDGSIATITYTSVGDSGFPKERVEVFGGGRVGVIEDYRELTQSHDGKSTRQRSSSQDKGHRSELEYFIRAARGQVDLSDLCAENIESSLATLKIVEALETERWVPVSRVLPEAHGGDSE